MYDMLALYEATSVENAVALRIEHPEAQIIAGGTDGGIFGAAAVRTQGKTDLEATELMRLIKNI